VLDEVDAALDGPNVQRVAGYLKKRAEQDDMQFLTISLKEKCYSVTEALVGVYVERSEESSRTLTLDLADYNIQQRTEAI
jgi:structural maintenance of chromosome 1